MFWSQTGRAPWTVRRAFRSVLERRPCIPQLRRFQSDAANTRNLALVAHIDSGKTTLTESILFVSNYLSSPGSVDTGSTTTDFLPAERERGITIQSASIPIKWKDWRFNLIDTPGHADFGMEVESASRVVDGAVVLIDSVEGVEAQTLGVWNQLDRYKVPARMLFLNKLDRPGASACSSVASVLANRLHHCPLTIALPVASFNPDNYKIAEPGLQGIVDLVKWEVWKWSGEDKPERILLPRSANFGTSDGLPSGHPLLEEIAKARTTVLDTLSMYSDELMDQVLSSSQDVPAYLDVNTETVVSALRAATLRSQVLPVLCGSALSHIGTELALNYAGELLPSPNDVALVPNNDGHVQLLAWKVTWDTRRGWMTFVRVYSGNLRRQTSLLNTTRNIKEKAQKLLLLYANQPEEVEVLAFGSVGVVLGLKHTRTGDTLTSVGYSKSTSSTLPDISPPPAVMSLSILPQSSSDTQAVQDALLALSRTDPSARVEITDGQILVHGLGALHLEIVENRLRNEWNVRFESGSRHVTYREGFGEGILDIDEVWEGSIGGKAVNVSLRMSVKRLNEATRGDPLWDGNSVVDGDGNALPQPDAVGRSPLIFIAQGISALLSNSPHTSLRLSQLSIQIHCFSISDEHNSSALARATSAIFRNALLDAGMGPILEPYIGLRVAVSDEHTGNVIKDITENEGIVSDLAQASASGDDALPLSSEGIYIPPDWISPSSSQGGGSARASRSKRVIHASAPLNRMLDFAMRLRSLTAGHGTFEMSNAYFHKTTPERQTEILTEIGRL